MANLNIPDRAVRQQTASAVNMVIQVNRFSDGARRVTSVAEITGMEQDVITMQEIFVFEKTGINESGKVVGQFRATGIRPKCAEKLITSGFKLPTEMFEHVHPVNMPEHHRLGDRVRSFR
jgi:pilus assembly protein CpaF